MNLYSSLGQRTLSKKSHLEVVRFLVEEVGLTIEDVRCAGNYALGCALSKDRKEVVRYLVVGLTSKDVLNCGNWVLGLAGQNGCLGVIGVS